MITVQATLDDLAECLGEVHTQAAIYDFHVIMASASHAAISEARRRPTDPAAAPPQNGIIIDATDSGFLKARMPADIEVDDADWDSSPHFGDEISGLLPPFKQILGLPCDALDEMEGTLTPPPLATLVAAISGPAGRLYKRTV